MLYEDCNPAINPTLTRNLMNKVTGHAVVLGGSGGIGREVVLAVARAGASAVSFTYGKNKDAAESLASELSEMGVRSYFASVPRLDEAAFASFLEEAVRALGEEPSMAVDTIGISPNQGHAEQKLSHKHPEYPGWAEVFEVNVFGSFAALRTLAGRMQSKGMEGSIVLITSTNGVNSQAEYSVHYDASKAAQAHMMRTLAEPYARHSIRINAVAPGWVDTSMNMTLPPGEKEKETAKIWLERFARPEEIANVVIFLLSSDSSYIVGQNVLVDGGYR
jgi:3-oxoacyl-[acyl-carrier protein] reductase